MIPVTDHLPIALRAYAQAPKARKRHRGIGASDWALIFDCETRTDAGQALRFGAYQLRKGDELKMAGLFYDVEGMTEAEVTQLRDFARRDNLMVHTRDEFVDEVLFQRAYQLRARIVGFNLPFDISRLALSHGPARRGMYGGFTFTLSHQKIWPNIRIKHISRRCALIDFAAPFRQRDSRGQRNRNVRTQVRRGYFVDVNTLAASLLSQNFTLGRLSRFLGVPNPKLEFDDFDGALSEEMLTYAVRDVQTTWECYVALLKKLDALELPDLRPEEIYSEASIGKGYLRAMGIKPWREMQPDFPPEVMGHILSSYYGGRSEVRMRREVREVVLCDFLSMYPTVCALMGLWRFVIANGIKRRRATQATRKFLSKVSLSDLQSPDTWPKLATLVRVHPDTDIFPVRANYEGEALATIGTNLLSSETPLWFTLADCIASKLLTGKAPKVLEAVTFEPGPAQADLRPIKVNGNSRYRVDPTTTDFFKRVIELRKATQASMASAEGTALAELDSEQHALKIGANSTSYGIWMQVNVTKQAKNFTATIFGHDGDPFERDTDKVEMPGEYFHPLLGSLITGAARLMLAITESQIEKQGLDWAFCDTDSMAIAKPKAMPGDRFRQRVQEITDWFAALNPYDFPGSILKIERENGSLATGEPEPLYCWAVSSKRYALFNLASDGRPILRKVSAHGLGHLLPPYGADNPPTDIPAPHESVMRSGVERWHCDLWFETVRAGLGAKPDMPRLDFHPAMSAPAVSRYGATAPELLRWFDGYNANRAYRDQVKPFGFLVALRANQDWRSKEAVISIPRRGRPPRLVPPKPVAAFERDLAKVAGTAFDRESGKPIPTRDLQTYREAVAQYHLHPEFKFMGADYLDRETTRRRHVRVSGIRQIGKEANDWERQYVLGHDPSAQPVYGLSPDEIGDLQCELSRLCDVFSTYQIATVGRTTAKRLSEFIAAEPNSNFVVQNAESMKELTRHFTRKEESERAELENLDQLISDKGLRKTARSLAVDPSNLRRRIDKFRQRSRT